MVFAWVGMHPEGIPALASLLALGAPIKAVLTLRADLATKKPAVADYRPLCRQYGIPLHEIANINEPQAQLLLCDLSPDVVFVMGWHQIVRPASVRLARLGMIGAHASLLPHNRGSAPVNWALIRGERETGSTIFWLGDQVDAGEVIDQRPIPITPFDTVATLYQKVSDANRQMLADLLPQLLAGERPTKPIPFANGTALPRRRPADGLVAWDQSAATVYDFVRALTRPYPGAFGVLGGRRWRIWQAARLPEPVRVAAAPGTVVGPVVSPSPDACGQMVACGEGAVVLLELEDDAGRVLKGPPLADQPWTGMRWDGD
jgi:methionyl-tRNA formyltransferase